MNKVLIAPSKIIISLINSMLEEDPQSRSSTDLMLNKLSSIALIKENWRIDNFTFIPLQNLK